MSNPAEQMSADGKSVHNVITGAGQTITTGAASAQAGSALPINSTSIRVACTSAAWLHIDTRTGIAAAANVDIYLTANVPPEYFIVPPGAFISAIQDSVAGKVYISPCL
jgi:hypothetical protein